jgi:phage/plasmid-associated DNA primase
VIKASDDGVWRRVKEVPFTVQFTHPDTTLEDRLVERHGKAVLRWLVEGAKEYSKEHTLPPCPAVESANRKYRMEQDSIEGWFADRVVERDTIATSFTDLYLDYEGWCADNGGFEQSKKSLAHKLEQKGFKVVIGGGRQKRFIGIELSV